ncbi:C-reactive protein-like [Gastrophryne carolinensis]
MDKKVFLFPKPASTDQVTLKANLKEPLKQASVCFKSYTELQQRHALFSMVTPTNNETLLIMSQPPNYYRVFVNQQENIIRVDPETLDMKHTCVTWDSDTGVIQLWINGKPYPRRVASKGLLMETNATIVLGQQQYWWMRWQDDPSFEGEISDVHMWDYVLTPKEIKLVIYGRHRGNLINWKSLDYEIEGDVLVQPKLQCKYIGDNKLC